MEHNLINFKQYPQHHFFLSTENVLNLHSNVKLEVGDTIVNEKERFTVIKIQNLQSDLTFGRDEFSEETEAGNKSKFNAAGEEVIAEYLEDIIIHSTPKTIFYNLKLERE